MSNGYGVLILRSQSSNANSQDASLEKCPDTNSCLSWHAPDKGKRQESIRDDSIVRYSWHPSGLGQIFILSIWGVYYMQDWTIYYYYYLTLKKQIGIIGIILTCCNLNPISGRERRLMTLLICWLLSFILCISNWKGISNSSVTNRIGFFIS